LTFVPIFRSFRVDTFLPRINSGQPSQVHTAANGAINLESARLRIGHRRLRAQPGEVGGAKRITSEAFVG